MNISFENVDNLWVAEFEVKSDFNIHLERDAEGRLNIYQRTAGEKYELMYGTGFLDRKTVYDCDFTSLVYPKSIKIVSAVNPTLTVVTAASGNDDDITVSNGLLEYHFEIPMKEDENIFTGGYSGSLEGDFSDFLNKVSALCDANGGVVSEEVWAEKANVTVNQYRVTGAPYGMNHDGSCDLSTNAPEPPGFGNMLSVTPTSVYFEHGV